LNKGSWGPAIKQLEAYKFVKRSNDSKYNYAVNFKLPKRTSVKDKFKITYRGGKLAQRIEDGEADAAPVPVIPVPPAAAGPAPGPPLPVPGPAPGPALIPAPAQLHAIPQHGQPGPLPPDPTELSDDEDDDCVVISSDDEFGDADEEDLESEPDFDPEQMEWAMRESKAAATLPTPPNTPRGSQGSNSYGSPSRDYGQAGTSGRAANGADEGSDDDVIFVSDTTPRRDPIQNRKKAPT
jgi:hypothetical protein